MKENLKLIKTEAENYYQSHSVGNSLSNISKKHSELVSKELVAWALSINEINQVYKLADQFIESNK